MYRETAPKLEQYIYWLLARCVFAFPVIRSFVNMTAPPIVSPSCGTPYPQGGFGHQYPIETPNWRGPELNRLSQGYEACVLPFDLPATLISLSNILTIMFILNVVLMTGFTVILGLMMMFTLGIVGSDSAESLFPCAHV